MSDHVTLDVTLVNEVTLEDPSIFQRTRVFFVDLMKQQLQPYYDFWLFLKSIVIQAKGGSR